MIKDLIDSIPESDFDVQLEGQVEIIGWLYQYYNEEPKNFAFKKKTYKKEEIPAVTQLFTPDWIVRYMVENSVGRYWVRALLKRGNSRSEQEIAQYFGWKYYLPESIDNRKFFYSNTPTYQSVKPEDITIIDPAMGSGHILVYSYDILQQIYESEGFSKKDAAELILKKNLFGLDIDNRAFQLTYFSIMMKARQDNRKILTQGIHPNVFDVPNTSERVDSADLLIQKAKVNNPDELKDSLNRLFSIFSHGDSLGSIIKIDSSMNFEDLQKLTKSDLLINEDGFDAIEAGRMQQTLRNVIPVAIILKSQFTVAITNPPYMQAGKMPQDLKKFVASNYRDSKSDLFSVFIERLAKFVGSDGLYAMITQHQWMFLSSFENLRSKINKQSIINMVHLGTRAFEEIGGEVVQTTAFVIQNTQNLDYTSAFVRLVDYDSQKKKQVAYLDAVNSTGSQDVYRTNQANFNNIQGSPISYWASDKALHNFQYSKLGDIAEPRLGMATADNNRFLRMWFEVSFNNISFFTHGRQEAKKSLKKWFPYNKGGEYRKWYGNNEYVVNWANDGLEIQSFKDINGKVRSHNYNLEYIFKPAITWSALTSGNFSSRFSDDGFIFDNAGSSMFTENREELFYLQGLLTTPIVQKMLGFINPTLNFQPGTLAALPVQKSSNKVTIISEVKETIRLSKNDWDTFEISWDFERHPLVQHIDEHNRNRRATSLLNHHNVPNLCRKNFWEVNYG